MILVDANVWIDHLGRPEPVLNGLLADKQVIMHPFVLGEIALGSIGGRGSVLAEMARLLEATVATHDEVLTLIEIERLFGRGIGYIDAHVIASVRLTPDVLPWARDRRLRAVATDFGLAAAID